LKKKEKKKKKGERKKEKKKKKGEPTKTKNIQFARKTDCRGSIREKEKKSVGYRKSVQAQYDFFGGKRIFPENPYCKKRTSAPITPIRPLSGNSAV